MLKPIFLLLSMAYSFQSLAQLPQFTEAEKAEHKAKIGVITSTAAACLQSTYSDHIAFYDQWKFSKYYGNRNPKYSSKALRYNAVRSLIQLKGLSDQQVGQLVHQMEPTACITMTLNCLGEGFEAAGTDSTWEKIYSHLSIENRFYGTDLQSMLRNLGWKTYYWNPDPSQNKAWDAEDQLLTPLATGRSWMPVWGGHAVRYATVMKKRNYFGITIDDNQSLVGFKQTQPAFFKKAPFFVGTAHAGYHVFPGFQGQVIEAHSMRKITARENLEVSEFNPLAPNGGPKWTNSEKYRSGVIAIPPQQ